jgi:CubicO group peptidase (beta-lactamase class C family)
VAVPLSEKLSVLEERIPEIMAQQGVPGLGLALVEEGEVIWSQGFGVKNVSTQEPVDEATIFAAASLSKPPFAYVVLKLVEQGKLALDTPLAAYLPNAYEAAGIPPEEPRLGQVTLRQLLSHTAGFGNWGEGENGRINFDPGVRFRYSGEGYTFLQRVVEQVSGRPLHDYMAEQLFSPLGLAQSSYIWRPEYEPYDADGHGTSTTGGIGFKKPWAAFTLLTTAADYGCFLALMMSQGGGDVLHLHEETLTEMVTAQVQIDGSLAWGLGWGLVTTADGPYFWQWGDIGDYQAIALGSRGQQHGLVILTNSDHGLAACIEIVTAVWGPTLARPFVIAQSW